MLTQSGDFKLSTNISSRISLALLVFRLLLSFSWHLPLGSSCHLGLVSLNFDQNTLLYLSDS